jgi:hypothetical protein
MVNLRLIMYFLGDVIYALYYRLVKVPIASNRHMARLVNMPFGHQPAFVQKYIRLSIGKSMLANITPSRCNYILPTYVRDRYKFIPAGDQGSRALSGGQRTNKFDEILIGKANVHTSGPRPASGGSS